jgi:SAM-dependent methyltransferase
VIAGATSGARRIGRRMRRMVRVSTRRRRYDRNEVDFRTAIVRQGGTLEPRRPARAWRPWRNTALRSRDDVDTAVSTLVTAGLVPHPDRAKNWDGLVALGTILERVPRRFEVLEMGAARYSPLLRWLYQFGYRGLVGIDLVYAEASRRGPIRTLPMDLTNTTFEDGSFGAIACLSVIEHGVDTEAYLREASRLLRPGGVLVTSTDYWPDATDTRGATAYGAPVRVFERPEIEAFLASAARHGLFPIGPVDLDTQDRVVHWDRVELDYTFLVLSLVKRPRGLAEWATALVSRLGR